MSLILVILKFQIIFSIFKVQFSPDTRLLASASFDKSVKLWCGRTGRFLHSLRGHVGPVYQIAWSSDSRLLVSGSADSTLKVQFLGFFLGGGVQVPKLRKIRNQQAMNLTTPLLWIKNPRLKGVKREERRKNFLPKNCISIQNDDFTKKNSLRSPAIPTFPAILTFSNRTPQNSDPNSMQKSLPKVR